MCSDHEFPRSVPICKGQLHILEILNTILRIPPTYPTVLSNLLSIDWS